MLSYIVCWLGLFLNEQQQRPPPAQSFQPAIPVSSFRFANIGKSWLQLCKPRTIVTGGVVGSYSLLSRVIVSGGTNSTVMVIRKGSTIGSTM